MCEDEVAAALVLYASDVSTHLTTSQVFSTFPASRSLHTVTSSHKMNWILLAVLFPWTHPTSMYSLCRSLTLN